MTDKEISVVLKEIGHAQGMCAKFYDKWDDSVDMEDMLTMFKKGQDFCIENDYPSLDFIRENFDRKVLAKHGIYLDADLSLDISKSGVYIFLGDCKGRVCFRDWCVADVYLRHNSDLYVESLGMSKVYVSLYDNSRMRGYRERVYDHRKDKEGE